jgi:hypothetical protein
MMIDAALHIRSRRAGIAPMIRRCARWLCATLDALARLRRIPHPYL